MARPEKEGMGYFPHDTDSRDDIKLRKIMAVFGITGYGFYFIMLEEIYKTKNYEFEISDAETKLILAEMMKIDAETFEKILNKSMDIGLFDKSYYQKTNKITSEAIKKRTATVEAKRNKNKEYYSNKKGLADKENDLSQVSDAETMAESTQKEKEKESKKENKNNKYSCASDESQNENNSNPIKGNQPISDKPKDKEQEYFDIFWKAYPKKISKGDAEKAWKKIKPSSELLTKMLSAIERAKTCKNWLDDNGKYIPYPATWLNAKRWEDEYEESKLPRQEQLLI